MTAAATTVPPDGRDHPGNRIWQSGYPLPGNPGSTLGEMCLLPSLGWTRAPGLGGLLGGEDRFEAAGSPGPRRKRMATKDTGGQRQTTRRAEETEEASPEAAEEVRERQEKLSDDVEAILDEIDEVLEENAEEFVRSYVQKGGE